MGTFFEGFIRVFLAIRVESSKLFLFTDVDYASQNIAHYRL